MRVPAPRLLLGLAAVAVAFAAADTYVVVLALPDMMSSAQVPLDELQRAAPIVSGFLLGYVAMLPVIGRIADLRGRVPVLVGSLVVFAVGSLVTAAAYDLPSMVAGRFLQGIGGGGLVPATLALVADLYAPPRRGVPLGVVGAVQELGSVMGPLYGALVLAVADWRAIFWLNLAVGLVLAAALSSIGRPPGRRRRDLVSVVLLAVAGTTLTLLMTQPTGLVTHVTWGAPFVPLAGGNRWFSPLGAALLVVLLLVVVRSVVADQPLLDVRRWSAVFRRVDVAGAGLLTVSLSGVILAFATADPEVAVFSPVGPWQLAGSAVAAGLFAWRNRVSPHPLLPHRTFTATPAWGALAVSFLVGSALIAALVDIPVAARITVHPDSQLQAALVLLRFLVALPVGAVVGGYLTARIPAGIVTAIGMALAAAGFVWMSQWGPDSLARPVATVPLVLGGLGFGLALAPVNAALLAATESAVHGVASALLVVARMVGMLVGISALTTLGLRRYYASSADIPPPQEVCGGASRCEGYTAMLREAGLAQLEAIFLGAAVCAVLAGLVSLVTFASARTTQVPVAEALRPAG